jgi:predicted RNase H-like HicB family nuclease
VKLSITFQWSDEDGTYVVSLPERGDAIHKRGDTYENALARGKVLLEGLIEVRKQVWSRYP